MGNNFTLDKVADNDNDITNNPNNHENNNQKSGMSQNMNIDSNANLNINIHKNANSELIHNTTTNNQSIEDRIKLLNVYEIKLIEQETEIADREKILQQKKTRK